MLLKTVFLIGSDGTFFLFRHYSYSRFLFSKSSIEQSGLRSQLTVVSCWDRTLSLKWCHRVCCSLRWGLLPWRSFLLDFSVFHLDLHCPALEVWPCLKMSFSSFHNKVFRFERLRHVLHTTFSTVWLKFRTIWLVIINLALISSTFFHFLLTWTALLVFHSFLE